MTQTRRLLPVQHDLTTPRARARAARLRANEAAERLEDLAALVTTPVSHRMHRINLLSFVICRQTDRPYLTVQYPYTPPPPVHPYYTRINRPKLNIV